LIFEPVLPQKKSFKRKRMLFLRELFKVIETKIRIEALVLLIIGIIGLPIFLATPMIRVEAQFVDDTGDPLTSYDYLQVEKIFFNGNRKVYRYGVIYGEQVDGLHTEYDDEFWDSPALYPYSYETKIITLIASILIIIAGILLPLGLIHPALKWTGVGIALFAAIMIITGQMLFLDFGGWVLGEYYLDPYEGDYSVAFIFPLIVSLLTLIISGLYIFLKPLKIIEIPRKAKE
jgi:hypothetical protein